MAPFGLHSRLSILFLLAFLVLLYTCLGSFFPPNLALSTWLPPSPLPPPSHPFASPPFPPPPILGASCEPCLGKGEAVCSSLGENSIPRSVSHAGTNARLRRFLSKLQRGQPVKVSVIGGSVSKGQGLDGTMQSPDLVHNRIFSFLNETYPNPSHVYTNGAIGATGSDYFQYCFKEHIPEDSDLVIIELGVNDQNFIKTQKSYEMLLRTVLELPTSPAVISLEVFGLMFLEIANGGDLHLPFSSFYDVSTISLRSVILPSIMEDPLNYLEWFAKLNAKTGEPDLRHLGPKGHRLAGDLVIAYLDSQLCEMSQLESRFGVGSKRTNWDAIGLSKTDPPPMLLTEKFNPGHVANRANPQCQSTNSPRTKLTVPAGSVGWAEWSSSPNKNYLIATEPKAHLSLPFTTSLGQVVVSYLRSATFDLGQVDCWVDDDADDKVRMDGWWKLEINVAQ